MVTSRFPLAILLLATLFPMVSAQAAVIASIDRPDVELNESFTLKITVDTAIDVAPSSVMFEVTPASSLPTVTPALVVSTGSVVVKGFSSPPGVELGQPPSPNPTHPKANNPTRLMRN